MAPLQSFLTIARQAGLRLVPRPVGVALYGLGFRYAAAVFGRLPGSPEVWARNSYVSGALVPFLSDLDLSLWYSERPSAGAWTAIAEARRRVARAFPAIGEINVYVASEAENWLPWINRFELARDPELERRVGVKTREGGGELDLSAQAAAFLLRMLESDARNVIHSPNRRQAKWEAHLLAVEQAPCFGSALWKDQPASSLLTRIVRASIGLLGLSGAEASKAVASLERYFRAIAAGEKSSALVERLEREATWAFCFPHRFGFAEAAYRDMVRQPAYPGYWRELLLCQVAWECWGLTAHDPFVTDRAGLSTHWRNLLGLLRVVTDAGAAEEPRQAALLRSLVRSIEARIR